MKQAKHLPARLFGLTMLLAQGAFLTGFFAGKKQLTISGGIVVVLYDVMGIWLGFLKPAVPIAFTLIGAVALSAVGYPWYYGVFWASAAFGLFDLPAHLTKVFRPDISRRLSDRALFESGLVDKSQPLSVDPDDEVQADECWAEFERCLKRAFAALSETNQVSLQYLSSRPKDSTETQSRQRQAIEHLVLKAKHNLSAADEHLRKLQSLSTKDQRAVHKLRGAVAEYRTSVEVGWDRPDDVLSLAAVRQAKPHADRGDELLTDGLSEIGRSVEIRVGDGTWRYP